MIFLFFIIIQSFQSQWNRFFHINFNRCECDILAFHVFQWFKCWNDFMRWPIWSNRFWQNLKEKKNFNFFLIKKRYTKRMRCRSTHWKRDRFWIDYELHTFLDGIVRGHWMNSSDSVSDVKVIDAQKWSFSMVLKVCIQMVLSFFTNCNVLSEPL